jgi:hypothetical protein
VLQLSSNIPMKLSYAILGGLLLASASANIIPKPATPATPATPARAGVIQRVKNWLSFKPKVSQPKVSQPKVPQTKLSAASDEALSDANRMFDIAQKRYERANKKGTSDEALSDAMGMFDIAQKRYERAAKKIQNQKDDARELMNNEVKKSEMAQRRKDQMKIAAGVAGTAAVGAAGVGIAAASGAFGSNEGN